MKWIIIILTFTITSCAVQHHRCPAYTQNQENMKQIDRNDMKQLHYVTLDRKQWGQSFKGHRSSIRTVNTPKFSPYSNVPNHKNEKLIVIHNSYFDFHHTQTYDVGKDITEVDISNEWIIPLKLTDKIIDATCDAIALINKTPFSKATTYDKSQLRYASISMDVEDIKCILQLYPSPDRRSYCQFRHRKAYDGLCLSGHLRNIEEKNILQQKIKKFKHDIKNIDNVNLSRYLSNSISDIDGLTINLAVKDNFCS